MIEIKKQAKLYYGDGNFDILTPGDHVLCAATGKPIHLSMLRYWSVERQEAYFDCAVSARRNFVAEK